METLGHKTTSRFHDSVSLKSKLRLFSLYKKTQKYIDLLVDVQGHQMLFNGIFNGDPHPGMETYFPRVFGSTIGVAPAHWPFSFSQEISLHSKMVH